VDEVFCQNTGFTPLTGRSPVQALGAEGLIQTADSYQTGKTGGAAKV
jgi:hypothetical protein